MSKYTRLLPFLLLTGCPESPENLPDGSPIPAVDGAPGIGPSAPGSPGGSIPDPASTSFEVKEGEGLLLSGEIVYAGKEEGEILLQILSMEENQPPKLLHHQVLESIGAFQIETPGDLGSIRLIAFLDAGDDGPSPADPAAVLKLEISTESHTDLALVLEDTPDLGDMTPGTDHSQGLAPSTPEVPATETPGEEASTE